MMIICGMGRASPMRKFSASNLHWAAFVTTLIFIRHQFGLELRLLVFGPDGARG